MILETTQKPISRWPGSHHQSLEIEQLDDLQKTWALVAGPPSPRYPVFPFPATVVIVPLETSRTLLFPASAM
jgi:hypothetical protein